MGKVTFWRRKIYFSEENMKNYYWKKKNFVLCLQIPISMYPIGKAVGLIGSKCVYWLKSADGHVIYGHIRPKLVMKSNTLVLKFAYVLNFCVRNLRQISLKERVFLEKKTNNKPKYSSRCIIKKYVDLLVLLETKKILIWKIEKFETLHQQ